jgi:Papain-like cysteine protease AvrRpt2
MSDHPLGFSMQVQECTQWCWAAVVASLSSVVQGATAVSQGQVVEERAFFPGPHPDCASDCDCCSDPSHDGLCNRPGDIADALVQYGLASTTIGRPRGTVLFRDIADQIDSGLPVVLHISYGIQSSVGHILVIRDYGGSDSLVVADPEDGQNLAASFSSFQYQPPDDQTGISGTWDYAYFVGA